MVIISTLTNPECSFFPLYVSLSFSVLKPLNIMAGKRSVRAPTVLGAHVNFDRCSSSAHSDVQQHV